MSKVRAPRKPKDEELAVTVANQDKQIKVLIERCQELCKERDDLGGKVSHQMADIARLTDSLGREKESLAAMTHVMDRLRGWQDCAREVLTDTKPSEHLA